MLYNEVSKEELIKRAEKILNEHGKINKELCVKNQVSSSSVKKCFGNYTNLFKTIGYDNKFHRNTSKEEVLNDVSDFYEKYNDTSSTLYRKNGTYSQTVIDRFGGWVLLLEELGFQTKNKKHGFDYIVNETKKLIDEYGFLSVDIINDNCEFTYSALRSYFKSAEELSNFFGMEDLFSNSRSSKEKVISSILDSHIGKENYHREKTWDWLLNSESNRHMYVDFYIPEFNLAIEYDGEQHHRFIERFHKEEINFIKQQERDILKENLLRKNGVRLVRLDYSHKITPVLIKSLL